VVHRDVKPANLSLAAGGRGVKVLDVGLARTRERGLSGLTRVGVVLGSADYIAPEQVRDPRAAGPAADQYSLGCTLYYLLTGRPPFPDGNQVAKAMRQLTEEPRPVEDGRPGIPPAVAGVVRRLMAKRRRDRFGSAAEAAAALAAASAGCPADETRPAPALDVGGAETPQPGETAVGLSVCRTPAWPGATP
jgi:serine/threonine-protein kinase